MIRREQVRERLRLNAPLAEAVLTSFIRDAVAGVPVEYADAVLEHSLSLIAYPRSKAATALSCFIMVSSEKWERTTSSCWNAACIGGSINCNIPMKSFTLPQTRWHLSEKPNQGS